jgi:hypothetical protein
VLCVPGKRSERRFTTTDLRAIMPDTSAPPHLPAPSRDGLHSRYAANATEAHVGPPVGA